MDLVLLSLLVGLARASEARDTFIKPGHGLVWVMVEESGVEDNAKHNEDTSKEQGKEVVAKEGHGRGGFRDVVADEGHKDGEGEKHGDGVGNSLSALVWDEEHEASEEADRHYRQNDVDDEKLRPPLKV